MQGTSLTSVLRRSNAGVIAAAVAVAALLVGAGPARPALAASVAKAASAPSSTCAAARAAVAYRAGGQPVVPAPQRLVPCASETGFFSGETGIGVTKQGTVWFSAANGEWQLARSDDQGSSWQAFTVPGPQSESGCYVGTSALLPPCDPSEAGKYGTVTDSYLYVDPYTNKIMWSKTYGFAVCSSMNMSDDNGQTWTPVTRFACPGGDYEKIAAGPPPAGGAQPTGSADVVYSCANGPVPFPVVGPGRLCFKSLDGGLTYTPTGAPVVPSPLAPGCLHFQEPQRVGPDGTLYVPLNCGVAGSNPAGLVQVAISHDEGMTWSYSAVPTGNAGSSAGLIGGVSLDVDKAGNVYVVWPGADNHVYLAVSSDQGGTWKGPLDVGMPGVSEGNPHAQVAADRNRPGHIAIGYYGYTGTDSSHLNGYLTESFDAASADPTFYAAELNSPRQPLYFPTNGGNLPRNDYLGVTIAPDGTPWTALVKLLSPNPDSQGYIQSSGFAGRLVPANALSADHAVFRGRGATRPHGASSPRQRASSPRQRASSSRRRAAPHRARARQPRARG